MEQDVNVFDSSPFEETSLTVNPEVEASIDVQREVINYTELMRMAEMLAQSTIIPVQYQRRPENCFVALDMSARTGLSPLIVMQNLYVIQGKPSWSGSAVSALIKSSPQFKEVELVYVGEEGKDNWGAYVIAKKNGKIIKGGTVTIAIAKKEGWYQKSGSKWQTMPELMLAYRAYSWFGRVHAPELMMGMQSTEEVMDTVMIDQTGTQVKNPYEGRTL